MSTQGRTRSEGSCRRVLPHPDNLGVVRWLKRVHVRYLRNQVEDGAVPQHLGLIMDGNRRWARKAGFADVSVGHRYGADHLETVLGWCSQVGIDEVTAYVASADNLRQRSDHEVGTLLGLIETTITTALTRPHSPWSLRLAGDLAALPESTVERLQSCVDATRDRRCRVTLGIGYDPRHDIVSALKAALAPLAATGKSAAEIADTFTVTDIAEGAADRLGPDIDYVLRTSGERRISGFFPWQSAQANLYFARTYWPGLREVDFLRAIRAYSEIAR